MTAILDIYGREIIDSRGNPTVEVEVTLEDGAMGRAAVPSGASTGSLEALELRDKDKNRFRGKGVLKAIDAVNGEIADTLIGMDGTEQLALDNTLIELDGSNNKSNLGANATLGVSIAIAKAAANSLGLPLFQYLGGAFAHIMPVPMMNIINGGEHADNAIDIQEFMIMPMKADTIADAIRMGAEVFSHLRDILHEDGHNTNVGDEGGFAPGLNSADEALSAITKAIEKAGYKPGDEIMIALDAASTEFHSNGKYELKGEGKTLDSEGLIAYYQDLISKYPILSIEDAMAEDDHKGWKAITESIGERIQLVGDDLFVTNPTILQQGIQDGLANALLVKPNQIGTISETLKAVEIAQRSGYNCILSHRSGETEDTTIAHLAVATNCGQIKTGSLSRSDRLAKYNELIRIEDFLDDAATYSSFNPVFRA